MRLKTFNEAENFYCMLKLTRHKINMDICDTLTSHRNKPHFTLNIIYNRLCGKYNAMSLTGLAFL